MAVSTKPRRKYRPKPVALDTLALASRRAAKVPPAEIEAVMEPIAQSFQAMRQGVGGEDAWSILAGSVELALSIEHKGVVRGLQGHLKAAEAALAAIRQRAMSAGSWKPTPLYFQEIGALDEFTWLHKAQLESLSGGEWLAAHNRAAGIVSSARGTVLDVRVLQVDQAQLQLLGAAT